MARIKRTMPPWHPPESREHSIAGQIITFDDQGEAEVDDPEVLAVMREFPETFAVEAPPGEAPPEEQPPGSPDDFTEAQLDELTVADLQDIATGLNIVGVRNMRKADLVESILQQQRITGGR